MNDDDVEHSPLHIMDDPVNVFPHKISTSTLKRGSAGAKRTFLLKEKRESIVWEARALLVTIIEHWDKKMIIVILVIVQRMTVVLQRVSYCSDHCQHVTKNVIKSLIISLIWSLIISLRCDHITDMTTDRQAWSSCDLGSSLLYYCTTDSNFNISENRRNKCDKEWIKTDNN